MWSKGPLGPLWDFCVAEQAARSFAQPPTKAATMSVGSNRWVGNPFSCCQRAVTNDLFSWAIFICRSCPHSTGGSCLTLQSKRVPVRYSFHLIQCNCRSQGYVHICLFVCFPFHLSSFTRSSKEHGEVGVLYHPAGSPGMPMVPHEPAPSSLPCHGGLQRWMMQKLGQNPLHMGNCT